MRPRNGAALRVESVPGLQYPTAHQAAPAAPRPPACPGAAPL